MIALDSRARKWVYGACAFIVNALFVLLLVWAESFDPNWKPLLWGMIALGGLVDMYLALPEVRFGRVKIQREVKWMVEE